MKAIDVPLFLKTWLLQTFRALFIMSGFLLSEEYRWLARLTCFLTILASGGPYETLYRKEVKKWVAKLGDRNCELNSHEILNRERTSNRSDVPYSHWLCAFLNSPQVEKKTMKEQALICKAESIPGRINIWEYSFLQIVIEPFYVHELLIDSGRIGRARFYFIGHQL